MNVEGLGFRGFLRFIPLFLTVCKTVSPQLLLVFIIIIIITIIILGLVLLLFVFMLSAFSGTKRVSYMYVEGLGFWGFLRLTPLFSMMSKTLSPRFLLVSMIMIIVVVLLLFLSVSMLAALLRNKMYSGLNVEGVRVLGFLKVNTTTLNGE